MSWPPSILQMYAKLGLAFAMIWDLLKWLNSTPEMVSRYYVKVTWLISVTELITCFNRLPIVGISWGFQHDDRSSTLGITAAQQGIGQSGMARFPLPISPSPPLFHMHFVIRHNTRHMNASITPPVWCTGICGYGESRTRSWSFIRRMGSQFCCVSVGWVLAWNVDHFRFLHKATTFHFSAGEVIATTNHDETIVYADIGKCETRTETTFPKEWHATSNNYLSKLKNY